jgi:hypothetical protein
MVELNSATFILIPQALEPKLAGLDAREAAHRLVVFQAVERLIKDYIAPAIDLAQISDIEPDSIFFNLEACVGCEISGLARSGFFDPKFPDLQKPSDAVLQEALDFIDIETSDPEQRDKIFRCWVAEMASLSVGLMLKFLRDTAPPSVDIASCEEQQLTALLSYPLTSSLEYQISKFVDHLQHFVRQHHEIP